MIGTKRIYKTSIQIIDGDRGINYPNQSEFFESGYCLFLNTGNVTKEGFDFSKCSFISKPKDEKLRKGKLKRGDLVLTTRGTVGNIAVFVDAINYDHIRINSGMVILRPDKDEYNNIFLYYLIKSNYIQEQIQLFSSGTAQPQLPIKDLRKISLPETDIKLQHRIASILSAYDDLIEVNNQRIKLLEETARELYKEWFVRMRFPGHKEAKFVKGMPKGWEVKKLSELVRTQYGFTASATNENIGPKLLRITDVANGDINWDDVPHCAISEKDEDKYLLNNGDIVVARTGATVGYAKRINKYHPKSVFASYLVRLKSIDSNMSYYIGIIAESDNYKEFIQAVASGAAQPQANANLMTGFSLFKPTDSLILKFNKIVEPIIDQKETLQQQNTQLRQIRDRLLPRLISGKLEVK